MDEDKKLIIKSLPLWFGLATIAGCVRVYNDTHSFLKSALVILMYPVILFVLRKMINKWG
jgi:hypothetical protein